MLVFRKHPFHTFTLICVKKKSRLQFPLLFHCIHPHKMADDNRTCSFTWTIENFSMYSMETEESLTSPTFRAESLGGSEWFLELYPKGIAQNKFVSIYLHKLGQKEYIDFEIKMIGANNEILESLKSVNDLVSEEGKGWTEFLTIEKLSKEMESWKKDVLTIHCLLKSYSKSTTFEANSSEARTKIGVNRCYFEWKITLSDSSKLNNIKDIFIGKDTKFELTLTVPSDKIEINIRRLDGERYKPTFVSCKISLMNLKGFEVETRNAKHLFKRNEVIVQTWKLPNFLSKKTLLDRADELLENNSFILKFEISSSFGEILSEYNVKYKTPSSSNASSLDNSFLTLHGDLRNMLNSKKYSDIKLRVESQIIPAHKLILSARSPVFSAMFDKDMLENQTGIVDIEDIDSKTMNLFLEYVYTGNMEELNVESAKKLLVAADKYQVSCLVDKCFIFLMPKLSVDNVCEIYTLADMIHHKHLKSSVLDYIEMNSTRVFSSKVWYDWMKINVELANEIFYKLALGHSQ